MQDAQALADVKAIVAATSEEERESSESDFGDEKAEDFAKKRLLDKADDEADVETKAPESSRQSQLTSRHGSQLTRTDTVVTNSPPGLNASGGRSSPWISEKGDTPSNDVSMNSLP